VEFGLKLTAKTGVVIAESATEAHIKVTLEWQRARSSDDVSAGDADAS
jgi:hypothetical protein